MAVLQTRRWLRTIGSACVRLPRPRRCLTGHGNMIRKEQTFELSREQHHGKTREVDNANSDISKHHFCLNRTSWKRICNVDVIFSKHAFVHSHNTRAFRAFKSRAPSSIIGSSRRPASLHHHWRNILASRNGLQVLRREPPQTCE
jgi:hypothetical protein